ncbi:alpha-(1-_6)-mannopyranosyltransferase A [Rhodococcus rhodnii]|nr:alpha-(1->6)-mannopyranosyltransferase A [Rhodococcus rhodnii]TXG91412.1 alpha-(1->6)-mannopyranosyltransferase A [Rhodococcus rhodnii]
MASADGSALRVRARSWADFVRAPEGHAALLGVLGAVLITFGGFGAGSVRREDPLLEALFLSWLRFGHGQWISTVLVWGGVIAMITAWVRLGRRTIAGDVSVRCLIGVCAAWVTPLLVAVPMFSRDAYSYLAQGALLRDGFDPYAVGPVVNPGLLLDNVSNVWTTTTAPYGPLFLLIAQGITMISGDNVVVGTLLLRLVMLPGLVLTLWAVPRLARYLGGSASVAVWLAVLNPLVLVHLIGGVHNEVLMVGLMTAGLVLALERKHLAGIALVSAGVAVKATAGAALPFIVWIWMAHRRKQAAEEGKPPPNPFTSFVRTAGAGAGLFVAIFGAVSFAAGVGLGWMTALSGSAKIINWLSLPTILAHIVTVGTSWFADLRLTEVLGVTRTICGAAMVAIAIAAWWRFRRTERDAVLGTLVVLVAIVVLSPAALPWYYSWPLAIAACFPLGARTLTVLVGLSTWLMLVFNPDGSIGLYNLAHVAVATLVALVAARSLYTIDPLRLRSQRPPGGDAVSASGERPPVGAA